MIHECFEPNWEKLSHPCYKAIRCDDETAFKIIRKDLSKYRYITFKSRELSIEALSKDGMLLEWTGNQTVEECLTAVKQNGYALCHAGYKTEEISFAACRQNYALAVLYVPQRIKDTDAWKQFRLEIKLTQGLIR